MMPKREIEAVVAEPYKTVFWTVVAVTDITKTLKLYETTCIVNSTAATATLYLPDVSQAKGMTYKVILRAGTNAVTIKDGANYGAISELWGDVAPNAAGEYAEFYSDGHSWTVTASSLSL